MNPHIDTAAGRGVVSEAEPLTMQEAVGYPAIDCAYQIAVEDVIVLKHDRFFLLVDGHGNIAPAGQCGLGLFHDDTRLLSHYELVLTGGDVELLSAQSPAPYHALVDLAVTDRALGGDAWDPKNVVHVRRELVLGDRFVERVTLTNYLTRPIDLGVNLYLASDFADIFEVRGWKRTQRGTFHAPVADDDSLRFRYRGRDGQLVQSCVTFGTPPTRITRRGASWQLTLEPGVRNMLQWEAGPDRPPPGAGSVTQAQLRRRLAAGYDDWRSRCSRWRTDVAEFDSTLRQAINDLRALHTDIAGERVITAGIPWYSTAFGRDSIITSLQTLPLNVDIAMETLRYLARHQGTKEDPFTEEQPGRIMHELRRGELARSGEVPHVPYYGTIDATPLWLVLLHETWRWTGNAALVHELLPHAERALDWIDRYGDIDGDGFVEYARTSEKGLVNQGWKDSGDGVPYPDGRLPDPPIALVEVQGYVHDAKLRLGQLYTDLGDVERGGALRREADVMRARIRERFWMEDAGTFALALDGSKRPLPTVTSNAGHLLWSRVPDAIQAARMAELFASPVMFSGWGIRTLAAEHPVYNPMSYHNGSVWPHDNALVVLGLSLYGHAARVLPVVDALHDVATHMRSHRLPELFCGMRRGGGIRPVQYPVSCSPQAWASGAFFMLLQGVLGILPDAPRGTLHIRQPVLPSFLRELTLTDLPVGGTRVSLHFRRHRERTLVNLIGLAGDPLQVQIELS